MTPPGRFALLVLVAAGCSSDPSGAPGSGESWAIDGGRHATSDAATAPGDAAPEAPWDAGASGKDAGPESGVESGSDSGSEDGSGGPEASDPIAAARAQCVQIINDYRATLNPPSPPLAEATPNESCVDGQAQADSASGVAHSAFGQCNEWAQNECPGYTGTPGSIMTYCLGQMWAEGPPPAGQDNHWLNMSNAQYTKVACGFYQTASGDWWATQDFW
jgi:hypothetical protein